MARPRSHLALIGRGLDPPNSPLFRLALGFVLLDPHDCWQDLEEPEVA